MEPEDIALDVIHEDDHVLIVNKPAGMVVHPTYRHPRGTVMNALVWRARECGNSFQPALVNRIDKGTSGLIVVARSAAAHRTLQRTFASGGAEKDYVAVVYGLTPTQGRIDLPLAHDPADRRRIVPSAEGGAPSLTLFERMARVDAPRAGLSLVACRLCSGRTHQIRVHMAASGWPIVGDPAYGEPRWAAVENPTLRDTLQAFPRQALHARRVAFPHPLTGRRIVSEAPPPDDLARLLAAAALDVI